MIDSFWTRRRVNQLAEGNSQIVRKWLDDYAEWIYIRAWYCGGEDEAGAARILEQTFLSVAQRLNEYIKSGQTIAEVLSSVFIQTTAESFTQAAHTTTGPEVQDAVGRLSTHPLLETESFWPDLIRLSQQALAMLSRDEQEILVCRYLRLEDPADIAAKYELAISDVQTRLYKSRHSFRRILESLSQVAGQESSRPLPADLASLEINLEKIFRALSSKPIPAPDVLQRLQEQILAVLTRNKPAGWNAGKKIAVTCGIVVLCGAVILAALWLNASSPKESLLQALQKTSSPAQQNNRQADTSNVTEDIQRVFELGATKDVEGLVGILRTGSYPAQIIAAHYLGQFGDKSAIDMLDRAAQKWYAGNPTEKNPFTEAIESIENRMRQEVQDALYQAQIEKSFPKAKEPNLVMQTALPAPNILPKTKKIAAEPNVPTPPTHVFSLPDANVLPETNVPAEAPDTPSIQTNLLPDPNIPQEEPNNLFIEVSMG
jgi:DNA-directed RNA polymerase specialized sigma24 family protein